MKSPRAGWVLGTCSLSVDAWAGSGDLALRVLSAEICHFSGPGHWQEDPNWTSAPGQGNRPAPGAPPLSQGLDLGGQKSSLGTLPFLVRENNICFGGGLQEYGDLTSRTKDLTRSLQQPTMPLPHLSYKRALLKASRSLGFLRHGPPVSLRGPATNLSLQTPTFWYCLASLCNGHTDLRSVTESKFEQSFL